MFLLTLPHSPWSTLAKAFPFTRPVSGRRRPPRQPQPWTSLGEPGMSRKSRSLRWLAPPGGGKMVMPDANVGYRGVLRTPGAAIFFFAAAIGRVGIAMIPLSLVWLLHARTGSYSASGLATAGFALAEALIGPQVARLFDRFGQTRVLPFSLLAAVIAIGGILVTTNSAAVVAASACAGAVVPQLAALSSARWAYLLRGSRASELPTAFSLEALANSAAFLLGPVLASSLGAAGAPELALVISASLIVCGGGVLASQRHTAPLPRRERAEPDQGSRTLLRPAFVLVAALNMALGLYFGTMGIAVSSFAINHGVPDAVAPIMAASSLTGIVGGLIYGRGRHRLSPRRQLIIAAGYMTSAASLLPLAHSTFMLGGVVVVTEIAIPPAITVLNILTENAVHPADLTQAFSWNASASAAGLALAASVAGRVVDAWGSSAVLAQAPAAGAILLMIALVVSGCRWTVQCPRQSSQIP